MSEEAALLKAIAAHPDEDAPRLAYADWLDEHHPPPSTPRGRGRKRGPTQNPRAEFIRAQIDLFRLGDYDTSAEAKALRARCDELLNAHGSDWHREFSDAVGHWVLRPEFRRGFPEHLRTPAKWFLENAEAIRRTLPTLTTLSVYRLNGWGERLAGSKHLRGVRELRVPCWIGAADGIALASSRHLKELEYLTLWVGNYGTDEVAMCRALGRSKAWPQMSHFIGQLRLVWDEDGRAADLVNREAGRELARGVDPLDRTFPFAADFDDTFFVGKLPDGRQVFAACPWVGQREIPALLFDAAGNQLEQRSVPIPTKHILRDKTRRETWPMFAARRDATFQDQRALVCKALGAEPADIRVRQFALEGSGVVCGVGHMSTQADNVMYLTAPPDEDFDGPYGPQGGAELGIGGVVEPWLGDHGMFTFTPGDGADPYFIGGSGRIVGR